MLQSRWSQNILIAGSAIVLILLCWWGWSNAVRAAHSKTIIKEAKTIQQGFKHFYEDQNRYPTTGEFEDANIMRSYLTNYPPVSFPTKNCPKSYDYYSASPGVYELRVCLPKAVAGFTVGWNILKP